MEITYNGRGGNIRSVRMSIISYLPVEKWRAVFVMMNGGVIVRETMCGGVKAVNWISLFIDNGHLIFRFWHFNYE